MHTFLKAFAMAAVATGGIIVSCTEKNNPSGTTVTPRNVIFSENFEGNADSVLANYMPLVPGQAKMPITNAIAFSGKQSLTSDSDNTGIKDFIGTPIEDSIAGIEFYLYAAAPQEIDFIAGMAQSGSAANGLSMLLGMGIDKSDSLKLYYQQTYPDPLIEKNLAPLGYKKWYKCNVEYDFNDSMLTCSLNDAVVYKQPASSPMQISHFVAMRDSIGSQGPRSTTLTISQFIRDRSGGMADAFFNKITFTHGGQVMNSHQIRTGFLNYTKYLRLITVLNLVTIPGVPFKVSAVLQDCSLKYIQLPINI